jgi:ATP/maltotriose-dependent transcriptional regulator MalT
VAGFTGSHRYVLDYLTQEVLDRQPEPLVGFLVETAVLERLCGPLCDAVTGRSGSQQLLEQVERANLFLVPLTRCAAGGATTSCSPTCCGRACTSSSPTGCRSCTGPRPPGEVLELLAAGRPNQAIADELVITLDTVKSHVTHILDKLGADNRIQAVTRARELGLLR